jgi:hypothetical protein
MLEIHQLGEAKGGALQQSLPISKSISYKGIDKFYLGIGNQKNA